MHWNRRRFWDGTGLPDTAKNRGELAHLANLISAEVRADRFTPERYLNYFQNGNYAHEVQPDEIAAAPQLVSSPTVREYSDLWIKLQRPPFVRAVRTPDYRQNITCSVLPVGINIGSGTKASMQG